MDSSTSEGQTRKVTPSEVRISARLGEAEARIISPLKKEGDGTIIYKFYLHPGPELSLGDLTRGTTA
jgi:hypothetical protein